MPKLARISGGETIRKLEKLGFKIARQRGSHVILKKRALQNHFFVIARSVSDVAISLKINAL